MIETLRSRSRSAAGPAFQRGLTLLELMVAMLLGLLVSAGIVALFTATNQTSRVQAAMSRIQENGRFAMSRIEADLRMAGAMFRQSSAADSSTWTRGTQGALMPRNAVLVNTNALVLQDLGTETGRLLEWPAPSIYPLSASFFIRGYECSTGTCTPAVPTGSNGFPPAGTAAGNRVIGSDALTVKYVRGTGWAYAIAPVGATGYAANFVVDSTSSDGTFNFASGDLVLVSDCGGSAPMLFQANVAGFVLTPRPGTLLDASKFVVGAGEGTCDERVFNFTRDFATISYWLQLVADPNPAAPGRLIPTLMRREDGVAQEVAQGVERLDFLYGAAMISTGGMAYLTADQVAPNSTVANCPKPSRSFQSGGVDIANWREPACLWRSLRSIEVHALFNTVDDVAVMSPQDMAYWYSVDSGSGPVAPGATMPVTGLTSGRMMRREFVSLASVRNGSN